MRKKFVFLCSVDLSKFWANTGHGKGKVRKVAKKKMKKACGNKRMGENILFIAHFQRKRYLNMEEVNPHQLRRFVRSQGILLGRYHKKNPVITLSRVRGEKVKKGDLVEKNLKNK